MLENKIRKNINRKDGDIYLSDLWDVCFLNIGRNIELEPKEDIAKQIEDISSLEGLENLGILNLKNHAGFITSKIIKILGGSGFDAHRYTGKRSGMLIKIKKIKNPNSGFK